MHIYRRTRHKETNDKCGENNQPNTQATILQNLPITKMNHTTHNVSKKLTQTGSNTTFNHVSSHLLQIYQASTNGVSISQNKNRRNNKQQHTLHVHQTVRAPNGNKWTRGSTPSMPIERQKTHTNPHSTATSSFDVMFKRLQCSGLCGEVEWEVYSLACLYGLEKTATLAHIFTWKPSACE